MERKEFLALMGLGVASIALSTCIGGCKKDQSDTSTTNPNTNGTGIDFTLDLSLPANSALNTNGGYLYSNGLIVAKTLAGTYIAVSKACTHEGTTVVYDKTNSRFYCASHGATFAESGAVTGGPAPTALKQYNTTLTGTMLRVYA